MRMRLKSKLEDDVAAYQKSVVILTAASGGVFDLFLKNELWDVPAAARRLKWTERGTQIIFNALCALGYLTKSEEMYTLTPAAQELFQEEDFELLKEWLLHRQRLMNRWVRLPEVLETGEPIRKADKRERKKNHRNFILSMAHRAKETLPQLLELVNLSGRQHLLDLGGGPGVFSIGFVKKYPELKATVFDSAETEPIAREFFQASGVQDRLSFRAGDFLEDNLGGPYDAALLSSVLHIYSSQENLKLLQKVYRALEEGGIIVIRDFFFNANKTNPVDAALFAVNMLVNTERGNVYSLNEVKDWLQEVGFRKIKKVKLRGSFRLIIAEKPAAGEGSR